MTCMLLYLSEMVSVMEVFESIRDSVNGPRQLRGCRISINAPVGVVIIGPMEITSNRFIALLLC